MKLNSLEMYEKNKKWLEYNGFSEALEEISGELYVVRLLVENELNPHGCIINQGVCSLLDTLAGKLTDLAAGRPPHSLLPSRQDSTSAVTN